MVNYNDARLNTVFAALADPTRRGILAALAGGSQPASRLAQPLAMSLPGFMKHLNILEKAGLVERKKGGRVVTCTLSAEPLHDAAAWIAHYQPFWEARLDALASYLEQENASWTPRKSPRSTSPAATKPPRKKSGARSRNRKP